MLRNTTALRAHAIETLPGNMAEHPGLTPVEVMDPYQGDVIAHVAACTTHTVDEACRTAQGAQDRGLAQWQRARVLERLAVLLERDATRLAAIITLETGKPIRDARTEVVRATETARFAAAEARTLTGELVPAEATPTGEGKLALAMRLPVGVVAAITPFNFPLNTVMHKVAPAIAAGCAVVLKPAHQTPLTALALRDSLLEAGLPSDWLTVVTDDGTSAGPALVVHSIPKLITFTGSTRVGWEIAAKAYRKKVSLELGSNAPAIVAADADLITAATKITRAAFGTAGQSCISVQRVIIHRSVKEELLGLLRERADALVVGDPFDEDTDVGPLIRVTAAQRVSDWISEAVVAGGRVVAGGQREGVCLRPTIVDGAPLGTQLRGSEAFGPVLTTLTYDDIDEAFSLANETVYGLQAGIFTRDLDIALQAARKLEFGGILVNDVPTARLDQQPYGGLGDSGNTREGPRYTAREMTEVRYLSFEPSRGSRP